MKHRLSLVFCVLMMLFSASCGGKVPENTAEEIRALYRDTDGCVMQADIGADFGAYTQAFTLSYTYAKSADSIVEIIAPEEVRGVRAVIAPGGTTLEFDGMSMETGDLAGTGLSPADMLPTLMKTWGENAAVATGREKVGGEDAFHLTYKTTSGEVEIERHTWFAVDGYKPLKAEVLADGALILRAEFTVFSFGVS